MGFDRKSILWLLMSTFSGAFIIFGFVALFRPTPFNVSISVIGLIGFVITGFIGSKVK